MIARFTDELMLSPYFDSSLILSVTSNQALFHLLSGVLTTQALLVIFVL